jgi:hypothetical protein
MLTGAFCAPPPGGSGETRVVGFQRGESRRRLVDKYRRKEVQRSTCRGRRRSCSSRRSTTSRMVPPGRRRSCNFQVPGSRRRRRDLESSEPYGRCRARGAAPPALPTAPPTLFLHLSSVLRYVASGLSSARCCKSLGCSNSLMRQKAPRRSGSGGGPSATVCGAGNGLVSFACSFLKPPG